MTRQSSVVSSRDLFGCAKEMTEAKENSAVTEYRRAMFERYCKGREAMVFQMDAIEKHFGRLKALVVSEKISNLVLLNHLCLLFPNVTEVGIYSRRSGKKFSVDLHALLVELETGNCYNLERVQLRCRHGGSERGSWLCSAWSTDLEFMFHRKKWKAMFLAGKGKHF